MLECKTSIRLLLLGVELNYCSKQANGIIKLKYNGIQNNCNTFGQCKNNLEMDQLVNITLYHDFGGWQINDSISIKRKYKTVIIFIDKRRGIK